MPVDELLDLGHLVAAGAGVVQLREDLLVVKKRLHGAPQHGPQEEIPDGRLLPVVVDEPHVVAEAFEVAFQGEGLEYTAVVGIEGEGQKGDFHVGLMRVWGGRVR